MNFNKIFTTTYRWTAISFLFGIFFIAFCYAFLIIFFVTSNSWITPIKISPNHEKVLNSLQFQVSSLQGNIGKQRIDLEAAIQTNTTLSKQIQGIDEILHKLSSAINTEASALNATGKAYEKSLEGKRADIERTKGSTEGAKYLLEQTEKELNARLITSDQAMQRRIFLESVINTETDSKTQAITLTEQTRQIKSMAATFTGKNESPAAVITLKQVFELQTAKMQLQVQLNNNLSFTENLKLSIAENERVLSVAKTSPYYSALRQTVNVAFIPYQNIDSLKIGSKVYDCTFMIIHCHDAGKIVRIYDSEEYSKHPLFKIDLKGHFAEIELTDTKSGESSILFVDGKPLFL